MNIALLLIFDLVSVIFGNKYNVNVRNNYTNVLHDIFSGVVWKA